MRNNLFSFLFDASKSLINVIGRCSHNRRYPSPFFISPRGRLVHCVGVEKCNVIRKTLGDASGNKQEYATIRGYCFALLPSGNTGNFYRAVRCFISQMKALSSGIV